MTQPRPPAPDRIGIFRRAAMERYSEPAQNDVPFQAPRWQAGACGIGVLALLAAALLALWGA